jgi:oligo-alginate lyase
MCAAAEIEKLRFGRFDNWALFLEVLCSGVVRSCIMDRRTLLLLASLLPLMNTTASLAQEPHLFLSVQEIAERNAIADREPWARAARDEMMQVANSFPEAYNKRYGLEKFAVPTEGGQWMHWYVCPDTGTHLQFHPPNHNVCPDTGKEYSGAPINQVVNQLKNDDLGQDAITLGLAYRFANDPRYASSAALILRAYADQYGHYLLHDNNNKSDTPHAARAYSQTLDESIWLIELTWTYDLIRGSGVLTTEDKAHIENDLLRPSAATVGKAPKEATPNIQSWVNGAVAAVGYELNDPAMIHYALDGPLGFRHQMKVFVKEGFWLEGAWGYQFYAMRPLTMTAQMAARHGNNLWKEEPAFASLFHGPLGVTLPNGALPAFNDSHEVDLYAQAGLYEVAFAATHDTALLPVVEQHGRLNREALLFGVEKLPALNTSANKSAVFPEAGYATLRAPKGTLTVITKFGEHGGGHGHNDKLGFILYDGDRTLGIDPATQLYGLPMHREWDKMTVAHNTVGVDETMQAASAGKLIDWRAESGWTAMTADAGPVYPYAALKRSILVTGEYVLVVDADRSLDGSAHTFDLSYHNVGTEQVLTHQTGSPFSGFGKRDGYGHLQDTFTLNGTGEVVLRFTTPPKSSKAEHSEYSTMIAASDYSGKSADTIAQDLPRTTALDVILHLDNGAELFTGTAPGPDLRVPVPFLLDRQKGTAVRFITLFFPRETLPGGPDLSFDNAADGSVVVNGPGFTDIFTPGDHLAYSRQVVKR